MYVTHIKWYTWHIPHPVSNTQGHPSTWNSVITTVHASQALASSGEEVNTEQTTYSKNKKHRTNYLLKKEHSVTKSTQNKLPTPHITNSLLKKITQSWSQHRTNSLLKKITQLLKPTTPLRRTATFRAIPPILFFLTCPLTLCLPKNRTPDANPSKRIFFFFSSWNKNGC